MLLIVLITYLSTGRRMLLAIVPALIMGGLMFSLPTHGSPSSLGVHAYETSRYRLSVRFEVDGAAVSESTIIDYDLQASSGLGTGSNITNSLRSGEAMIVPIPGVGNIYVLPIHHAYNRSVRPGRGPSLIADSCAFVPSYSLGNRQEQIDWVRSVATFEGRCKVPESGIPTMVRFVDPDDFMTMEWLSTNDIASLSGGRARFLEAWVETTRERPMFRHTAHLRRLTVGIERPVAFVTDPYSGFEAPFFPSYLSTELR